MMDVRILLLQLVIGDWSVTKKSGEREGAKSAKKDAKEIQKVMCGLRNAYSARRETDPMNL
jgi:hypothetical protein